MTTIAAARPTIQYPEPERSVNDAQLAAAGFLAPDAAAGPRLTSAHAGGWPRWLGCWEGELRWAIDSG
jgi:hypothetical protein